MAKKKKEDIIEIESGPKLRPELYWEWRCSINEMDLAKKEKDIGQLKLESMAKDLEIARLRAGMFKQSLSSVEDKVVSTKNEYEKMKERIEKEINMSLNECVIDDITFEVKKL